jgi:hypothetical protein
MSGRENTFQLSFILDRQLRQFNFLATQQEVDRVVHSLSDVLRGSVQDFQIYTPSSASKTIVADGSAAHLIETLEEACEPSGAAEKSEFARVAELSERVDAESAISPGAVSILEFVWSNGGGDDNAFGQSYLAPADKSLSDEFEKAVSGLMGRYSYDLSFNAPSDHEPEGDMEDALEVLYDSLESSGRKELAEHVAELFEGCTPSLML